MIPLGDVVPTRTRPVLTTSLVIGLAIAQVALLTVNAESRTAWLWSLGGTPGSFPWPALATAAWLECSWLAGLANLAALALFAPAIEDRLGRLRLALLVALAEGLALTLSMALLRAPALPVGGAAAPAAVVLGAYLRLFPTSRVAFWIPGAGWGLYEVQAVWLILVWGLLVPGGLARLVNPAPGGAMPVAVVAAAVILGGLTAPRLARRERLAVSWWDRAPEAGGWPHGGRPAREAVAGQRRSASRSDLA